MSKQITDTVEGTLRYAARVAHGASKALALSCPDFTNAHDPSIYWRESNEQVELTYWFDTFDDLNNAIATATSWLNADAVHRDGDSHDCWRVESKDALVYLFLRKQSHD